jgi:hypothetical protein
MKKLFIERRASDNKYLHRDFHIALDQGLAYLGLEYGGGAVDEYLGNFARDYYAPLVLDARARGFAALREHIASIYEAEEARGAVAFAEAGGELLVAVSACPAVAFMRESGHAPSKWHVKTTSAVYGAIAKELGMGFEMASYDDETGAAEYRFFLQEVPI